MKATIKTSKGALIAKLFATETPKTTANFAKLADEDFYKNLSFHRVIPSFVIQGGCPQGTGSGGPGYTIECEIDAEKQHHNVGVLSMAHAGKDTGGSQFFICLSREQTAHLDGQHTCFGEIIEGLNILPTIEQGDRIIDIVIEK